MASKLADLLNIWKNNPGFLGNIAVWNSEPAHEAKYSGFPTYIHPDLINALRNMGIENLYTHQLESLKVISRGGNLVIVTGTASGKSLCYNLPVLQQMIMDGDSTALYVFPTKALSEDQEKKLSLLTNIAEPLDSPLRNIPVAVFDGDTASANRNTIRKHVRLLITNPDMLHLAVLPHHPLWVRFFQNLRFVIIDEIHYYRGLFGSHLANVIRRLKRIANYYGSFPQFILTSATIENPRQHAENLIEADVEVIDNDGSPRGSRQTIFYNPPIINRALGIRQSAISEIIPITKDLHNYKIQTLLFSRTRRSVELIIRKLHAQGDLEKNKIHGYRSGYLAKDRRRIESDFRDGKVITLVSTNALELGMDIGGIEAVILVGYPGTIASARQQAGRAGRKHELSLVILVASMSPIDQFLMRNPQYFFEKNAERAMINPNNFLLLLHHIRCSAFEIPFDSQASFGSLDQELLLNFLTHLEMTGEIYHSGNTHRWIGENYPASMVSLRNIDSNIFRLLLNERGSLRSIGSIDGASAKWMVHPDAIYIHDGITYLVEELNFDTLEVKLRLVETDYYTDPQNETNITLIQTLQEYSCDALNINYGEVEIISKVSGFQKINWQTNQILQTIPLDMPESKIITTAFWFSINNIVIEKLKNQKLWTSSPIEYGPNWNHQRLAALKRDFYSCQNCGKSDQNQPLHVHHKIPFRQFEDYNMANDLQNLITLCQECHKRAESVLRIRSGMAGLRYALHNMAAFMLMCDQSDIGSVAELKSIDGENSPMILIYDQIPGGIGLSQTLFEIYPELFKNTHLLIDQCSCEEGCPSCVGSAGEFGIGGKIETLTLIRELLNSIDRNS